MTIKSLILAFLGFSSISATAQIGQKLAECITVLGVPVKEFNAESPPTKIFIKESIQAQITFESGVAAAGVYHVAELRNWAKQSISDEQLETILRWSGIAVGDLVAANFKDTPAIDGVYKKTRDGKFLVKQDKRSNIVFIADYKSFLKYVESNKKP